MISADKRFTVDKRAARSYAAQNGSPEPTARDLERLTIAAAYAGIAYEAGLAGRTLSEALPIFRRISSRAQLSADLDAIRERMGDGTLTTAALDTISSAAVFAEAAYRAGCDGAPIEDRIPFFREAFFLDCGPAAALRQ